MANKLNQETAALMQLFPFKYPAYKYKSPQKRFIIITNEMFAMGVNAGISRVVSERNLIKTRYIYNVLIDFKYVKSYNSSAGAKNRIFREYLKLKKGAKWQKRINRSCQLTNSLKKTYHADHNTAKESRSSTWCPQNQR